MTFRQPPPTPADGTVELHRNADDTITIAITHDGVRQTLVASDYNATRLFGMLACWYRIPLAARVGRAIKLIPPGEGRRFTVSM